MRSKSLPPVAPLGSWARLTNGVRLTSMVTTVMMTAVMVALVASKPVRAQSTPPTPIADLTYPRYVNPAQCVEASKRLTALYWRDKRTDTIRYTPATDSVPTSVRTAIRACAARFTVKGVPTDQLLPLGELELVMGNDAEAQAAFDRLTASLSTASTDRRAWILDIMVHTALDARPSRMTLARRYLAQLDALGNAAAYGRLSAHTVMASYLWIAGDVAGTIAQSDAAIAGGRAMSRNDQLDLFDSLLVAYGGKKPAIVVRDGPQAALALLDTASSVLMPLTATGTRWGDQVKQGIMQWMGYEQGNTTPLGTLAKPVHGDYWFGGTPGDTVFPKPGRVTLMVFLNAAFSDFYMYAMVQRLHDKYAARGLDLVYMAYTMGSFRNTVHPKPANEVEQYKRWFLDYVHLPMTFAIEESQYGRLADGRRENTPMMNQKNYWHGDDGILVGKDGKIRLIIPVRGTEESILDQQIEAALSQ